MNDRVDDLYTKLKTGPSKYKEEEHCKLILEVMLDKNKGRISAFCVKALVCENTFFTWVNEYEMFRKCYLLGKMFAREEWEKEGLEIRERFNAPGVISNAFEHWKMIGWSRFGISKNSRIKLALNPDSKPNEHYSQLLRQAANGDYTASEIKQLMEAINVGLQAHQVIQLQKELDELKCDLQTMSKNANVQNSFANKGIEKED